MIAIRRMNAFLRGLLWLIRGAGLRGHLQQLDRRMDQVDHRLADTVPVLGAVQDHQNSDGHAILAACQKLDNLAINQRGDGHAILAACQKLDDLAINQRGDAHAIIAACQKLDNVSLQLRDAEVRLTQSIAQGVADEIRRRQLNTWRAAGDLRGFEFKVSSQNGEDGILQEIFRRIGTTTRHFVEFGVESGVECNSAYLVRQHQWAGLFLEASAADFEKLRERYRDCQGVRCVRAAVTSKNIEQLLRENGVPKDLDLLSIDIDGNDYWVWAAITDWQPRVVVIEYNPFHLPPKKWVMKEDDNYRWNRTTYFGASLTSLSLLGQRKGYDLVGTDSLGVNAFFVRRDCIQPGMFLDPTLHYHFTPLGHPPPCPHEGPFVEI